MQVVEDCMIENWSGWTTRKQKTGVGGWPENKAIGWVPVSRPLHLFNTSNNIACWWSWKQGYIYQQVHILGGRGKTCCSTAWIKPANWLQSQSSAQSWYPSAADEAWYWPECVLHKDDCSCSIALTKFRLCSLTWHNYTIMYKQLVKVSFSRQGIGVHVYHCIYTASASTCHSYVRCTGCIGSRLFLLWSRRWRYQSLLHPLSCGGYNSLCHSQEQHTRSRR